MKAMKIVQTKTISKTILAGVLICALCAVSIKVSSSSESLDFQEPVENMTLSGRNDYGTFNLIKRDLFHAGMDVKSARHDPLDFDTPVMASESGVVHKIFGLEHENANLMRCGGGWEPSPYYDSEDNFCGSHHNHGYGMSVIIKHEDQTFTLYAHLNCIEPGIGPGVKVERGQRIGVMGNSAYEYHYCNRGDCGASKGFNPHLHFEIKERGVLCDETDYGSNFAYTDAPPHQFGYLDPTLYLNRSKISSVNPLPVKLATDTVLRPGPGTKYGRLTNYRYPRTDLYRSSEFVVRRKAITSPDECGSGLWYQIFLPCLNTIGDTEGWICADDLVESARPMIEVVNANHDVKVRVKPSHKSKAVARAYNGQKFVYFATHSTGSTTQGNWYRIYLPNGSRYRSGWVSGEHIRPLKAQ